MTTPVDLIESRLTDKGRHPKRKGDGLVARCPAHDDNNPSLSVSPGTKGRDVLVHCHAGCAPAEILAALDLKWTDFSEKSTRGDIVATYDYTDTDGELLYQVVRLVPKSFRQRRPDGRGGWTWKLGDVSRTLYRLPAVVAAADDGGEVWVVEGEKDADNLAKLGLVATCNSGGAGKFTLEMAEHLKGAQVSIVADNDDPGRDHAAEVAFYADTAGAESVRILTPATGKDISEHLAAGLGVADLVPLELAPKEPDPHPLSRYLIDWADMWTHDPQPEWLVEPIIAAGRAHALYAGAKTGKSYLILAACAALATGQAFLSHPAGDPRSILYVDYEMTLEDVRDRLEEFGYSAADDLSRLHYALLPSLPPLDTAEGGEALLDAAKAVEAEFVVIDTTSRSISGEENDSDTMRAFYRHTGLLLKQVGIGWMRLDHAGKDIGRGQRGSSAKNDDVDIVLKLERTDSGQKLTATHRRMSWFPEETNIDVAEHSGVMTFRNPEGHAYAAGTKDCAQRLAELGYTPDDSQRHARQLLRDAGFRASNNVLRDAIRWTREGSFESLTGAVDNHVD